jgi:hypothetical protein
MRELTFAIEYADGADPLMDVFAETPELAAVSFDGCVFDDRFWRIEEFEGPPDAVERATELRTAGRGESVTATACEATADYETIERGDGRATVYSYVEGVTAGKTVHTVAGRHLPAGTLFASRRQRDRHDWWLLLRSDRSVGAFFDNLTAALRDGLSFRTGHLVDATGWKQPLGADLVLPGEQQVALETAMEMGYFETPRATTMEEIASALDVPRSTLSYRLRRALARLTETYLDQIRSCPEW